MIEAIVLKHKQKAKLLAMSKVLFPEYKKNIKLTESICYVNTFVTYNKRKMKSKGPCSWFEGDFFSISWLEFCLLHIAPKIQELKTFFTESTIYETALWNQITNNINPIDYLYSQFLKLQFK